MNAPSSHNWVCFNVGVITHICSEIMLLSVASPLLLILSRSKNVLALLNNFCLLLVNVNDRDWPVQVYTDLYKSFGVPNRTLSFDPLYAGAQLLFYLKYVMLNRNSAMLLTRRFTTRQHMYQP